jgi:epoxyqueuosine reductase
MSSNSQITKLIYSRLEENGCSGRIVPIQHLIDLKEEIEINRNKGIFDSTFYQERLVYFNYEIQETFPDANSIVITAAPQSQQKVHFDLQGKDFQVIVPPTYSSETDKKVEDIIAYILKPEGFDFRPAVLPLKSLAVHSGLAEYGKNNITYIQSIGSFYRLKAFFSDLPAIEDNWFEMELMEQCEKCSACIDKCPTGAIIPERFLMKAERCLTFHNERPDKFPTWIEPSWHNCLIGCMECQMVCPVNKKFRSRFEEEIRFSQEESTILLKERSSRQLPPEMINKLQRIGLSEDINLIPRNLGVLLEQNSM